MSGLNHDQESMILIAGGHSASAHGSKPATTTSPRSPPSQPSQPRRHRLGDRRQEGQIEVVDRVAGAVVMGIAQEGGVGGQQGVLAHIPEGGVVAEAHIGQPPAPVRHRQHPGGHMAAHAPGQSRQ